MGGEKSGSQPFKDWCPSGIDAWGDTVNNLINHFSNEIEYVPRRIVDDTNWGGGWCTGGQRCDSEVPRQATGSLMEGNRNEGRVLQLGRNVPCSSVKWEPPV